MQLQLPCSHGLAIHCGAEGALMCSFMALCLLGGGFVLAGCLVPVNERLAVCLADVLQSVRSSHTPAMSEAESVGLASASCCWVSCIGRQLHHAPFTRHALVCAMFSCMFSCCGGLTHAASKCVGSFSSTAFEAIECCGATPPAQQ